MVRESTSHRAPNSSPDRDRFAPGSIRDTLRYCVIVVVAMTALVPSAVASDANPAGPEFPPTPRVTLLPIEGFEDESAFVEATKSRIDAWVNRALAVSDHATAATLRLAAANLILAEQLEPDATRMILGIDDAATRDESISARRSALDRADDLLRLVRDHIASMPTGSAPPENPEEQAGRDASLPDVSRLAKDHALIQAFAAAMRVYLLSDSLSEGVDPRRAASALASALEDARPQVSAAATLWQAMLRTREADPKPALAGLDPVLLDPARNAMPYALFGRWLRCLTLARIDHPAAPIALLMRTEDALDEWIVGDATRAAARRAAALVRLHALRAWHDRLNPAVNAMERDWCAERARALLAEHFPAGGEAVYRFHPAVPIIATAPDLAPDHGIHQRRGE